MYKFHSIPRSKFRNVPSRCSSNVLHQSMLEARRCNELHIMKRAGTIVSLQAHPQPNIRLIVNNFHVCTIRPDFSYEEAGRHVLEDTKGVRTPLWRLKCKLLKALHGIEIIEVRV